MNRITSIALLLIGLAAPVVRADETIPLAPRVVDALAPRPLGPAVMGGRIVDVAVVADHPATIYVAAATGGLWKTTNNGTSWTPVFDRETTQSLGSVAVAPSNPEIVWVGTGEANPRNSVSWGDGVYKSTDGGKTWRNMGLKESHHVGRIMIHPKDPDVVWVAALGHLWGSNRERGVYKTTDGGKTWTQSKFINEDTGFVDLALDPADPDTLYAAAYTVRRGPFSGGSPADSPVVQTSREAGLHVTRDGGKTWMRLTQGLPENAIGRCGLDICRKDPRIVFAIIQTDKTSELRASELGQAAKTGDRAETGGVFRSEDRGRTWTKLNDLCPRGFYFSQLRVDPNNSRHLFVLGMRLHESTDGGKSFRAINSATVHADQHALWIDPANSEHLIDGCDGGLNFSYDGGGNWEHLKNLPIAQYYGAAVDNRKPYRVFGGLQDNGSWGGASGTHFRDGIGSADWFRLAEADGFYCQADPEDNETVYCEGQYGLFLHRLNTRTNTRVNLKPVAARGKPAYRFNWSAPLLISPHNARTLYYGANVLLRSVNRGDHWEEISPDLTRFEDGETHNNHTITALAESPLKAGLIFVGTDDGRVQVSRDGGGKWTDLSDNLADLAAERWITRLECSHFEEGTAFLAVDRHRQDDRKPYLYRTTDYGKTWKSIAGDLPLGSPVQVIREDLRNRDLLFAGTEFGLFVSLDGGGHWQPLRKDLPAVPIYDLVIHPRDRELVIATHGRSLYILDVQPLEELSPEVLKEPVHLFDVRPAVAFPYRAARSQSGGKFYNAPNPPFGAVIQYHLGEKPGVPLKIIIADPLGKTLATFKGEETVGLHDVVWNLRPTSGDDTELPLVKPGDYVVRVEAGDTVLARKKFKVEAEE